MKFYRVLALFDRHLGIISSPCCYLAGSLYRYVAMLPYFLLRCRYIGFTIVLYRYVDILTVVVCRCRMSLSSVVVVIACRCRLSLSSVVVASARYSDREMWPRSAIKHVHVVSWIHYIWWCV